MKTKIAVAVFAATVFVSMPFVFAAVYRHVYPQLAGEESARMITSVAFVYTVVVIYVPVLLVALLFWALIRSARRAEANPPSTRQTLYGPPRSRPTTWRASAARAHFMVDHPILYLALKILDALSGEPRHDRR